MIHPIGLQTEPNLDPLRPRLMDDDDMWTYQHDAITDAGLDPDDPAVWAAIDRVVRLLGEYNGPTSY